MVQPHDQPLTYSVTVGNLFEGSLLACDRKRHAGVHSAAEKHHRLFRFAFHRASLSILSPLFRLLARLPAKHPWSPGPTQICEAASPAAPAAHPLGSIPPPHAAAILATSLLDRQIREKKARLVLAPRADAV